MCLWYSRRKEEWRTVEMGLMLFQRPLYSISITTHRNSNNIIKWGQERWTTDEVHDQIHWTVDESMTVVCVPVRRRPSSRPSTLESSVPPSQSQGGQLLTLSGAIYWSGKRISPLQFTGSLTDCVTQEAHLISIRGRFNLHAAISPFVHPLNGN